MQGSASGVMACWYTKAERLPKYSSSLAPFKCTPLADDSMRKCRTRSLLSSPVWLPDGETGTFIASPKDPRYDVLSRTTNVPGSLSFSSWIACSLVMLGLNQYFDVSITNFMVGCPALRGLSETQESAGADSALFRPPSLGAGLQLGGGLCLTEAGGALASLEDASPCSRHPFTSSTGMSAVELRMEGGQLLACPFWDGEALAVVEQAALGWWGLRPKVSPERDLMLGEGGQGLPRELAGDGQSAERQAAG